MPWTGCQKRYQSIGILLGWAKESMKQILNQKANWKIIGIALFHNNNCQHRYKYLVLGSDKIYFVNNHSDSNEKFSEADIE